MRIIGVIPARYASTRFPGKPLVQLSGKPLIQHVVDQCRKSTALADLIVATDDSPIARAVEPFYQYLSLRFFLFREDLFRRSGFL